MDSFLSKEALVVKYLDLSAELADLFAHPEKWDPRIEKREQDLKREIVKLRAALQMTPVNIFHDL